MLQSNTEVSDVQGSKYKVFAVKEEKNIQRAKYVAVNSILHFTLRLQMFREMLIVFSKTPNESRITCGLLP